MLTLHVFGQAKRHRTFRHLVKKTKLFSFGGDVCYHDLACVGCARQELVGLAALIFLLVFTDRLFCVSVDHHNVVA
jgi:hypothetical protein